MEEKLTLTQEWDKTFPKSGKVGHSTGTRPTPAISARTPAPSWPISFGRI